MSYIKGKSPILFECELDDINRGCPLSFVSQFPGEQGRQIEQGQIEQGQLRARGVDGGKC